MEDSTRRTPFEALALLEIISIEARLRTTYRLLSLVWEQLPASRPPPGTIERIEDETRREVLAEWRSKGRSLGSLG